MKVKTEDKNLERDVYSNALLNSNRESLSDYRKKRQIMEQKIKNEKEFKERLENLENNMNEIKDLLKSLADIRKQ